MTFYFSKFPIIQYDLDGTGTNLRFVRDISHGAKFLPAILSNIQVMYPYFIKEGDTPDIIASKLYGTSQYHWIVMFCNNIFNLWQDWPLTNEQFGAYLIATYGSIDAPKTTIHHYEDVYGNTIDLDTFNATVSDGSVRIYTYDYEISVNEAKKQIQLVGAEYATTIENQLTALLTPLVR